MNCKGNTAMWFWQIKQNSEMNHMSKPGFWGRKGYLAIYSPPIGDFRL